MTPYTKGYRAGWQSYFEEQRRGKRRPGSVSSRRQTDAESGPDQNETLAIRLPTALVVHLRHWAFIREVSLAAFIEETLLRFCQELAADNKKQGQETAAKPLSTNGSFPTEYQTETLLLD
jgi:hypothetical protein